MVAESKDNYWYYVILKFLPVKAKNMFLLNKVIYLLYVHNAREVYVGG